MKNFTKFLFPLLVLSLSTPLLAKTKYSSYIQTAIANGKNIDKDDSYIGLWYLGKANIGLTRNSLASLNVKVGGQNHDDSDKNKTDIEFQGSYIYQSNSGYFSPTFSLKLQLSQEDFESSTTDKSAISFSMYKPISNKMEYGLTYRISEKTNSSDIETQSYIFNLDYFHNPKTTFYSTLIFADEKIETIITADQPIDNFSARNDIAGGHDPSEDGFHGPALTVGNHLINSDNTSIILGSVYSIDDKQAIDIAFIKHFYDTSISGSSSSHYLALDYFYKF